MKNTRADMERLSFEFQQCKNIFTALGDENRQRLLCTMFIGECSGSRVIELAKQTNLSRPAVSHHMQILKNAGIVKLRREGTYIYYYLDPADSEIKKVINLFSDIKQIVENAPDRNGDEDS